MFAPLKSFALASLALAVTARALDLTPHFGDMDSDGLTVRLPYFQDGQKRVFLSPPTGWKIDGSAQRALLTNDGTPRSNVTFLLSQRPTLPSGEAEVKALREAVLAMCAKDGENVASEGEAADPLPINGWKTFELKVGFDIAGTHFVKSILLVRLNAREELQVITTAPQGEFAKANGAAMTCLRTWHKE